MEICSQMLIFLNLRCKKLGFGNEKNVSNAQKWVPEELSQLISKNQPNSIDKTKHDDSIQLEQDPENNNRGIWSHFDQKVATKNNLLHYTVATLMMRQYLELSLVDRK